MRTTETIQNIHELLSTFSCVLIVIRGELSDIRTFIKLHFSHKYNISKYIKWFSHVSMVSFVTDFGFLSLSLSLTPIKCLAFFEVDLQNNSDVLNNAQYTYNLTENRYRFHKDLEIL